MDWIKEILSINPDDILSLVKIDKYSRKQSFSMQKLFPNDGKVCACGCGVELTGRKRRWASKKCQVLPLRIYFVLKGDLDTIRRILNVRDGHKCRQCDETQDLQVDHIHPVCKGGGGCWIDNYQYLCIAHHKIKTKVDIKK